MILGDMAFEPFTAKRTVDIQPEEAPLLCNVSERLVTPSPSFHEGPHESYMSASGTVWQRIVNVAKRVIATLPAVGGRDEEELDEANPFRHIHHDRYDDEPDGYPRFAAWIASDPNWTMSRGNFYLRNRIILHKQQKLEVLRRRLGELDRQHAAEHEFITTSVDYDLKRKGGVTDQLIEEIHVALKEFDDLLLRERAFRGLERPSNRNYSSVLGFLNHQQPIWPEEIVQFLHPDDLVSLANGTDNSWLDNQVERALGLLPRRVAEFIFTEPSKRVRTVDPKVRYYSRHRIAIFSAIISVGICAIMLTIPVAYLYGFDRARSSKLAISLVFIIGFPMVIAGCTRAQHQSIIAISAAYCAVVVAFLSQSSFQGTGAG